MTLHVKDESKSGRVDPPHPGGRPRCVVFEAAKSTKPAGPDDAGQPESFKPSSGIAAGATVCSRGC